MTLMLQSIKCLFALVRYSSQCQYWICLLSIVKPPTLKRCLSRHLLSFVSTCIDHCISFAKRVKVLPTDKPKSAEHMNWYRRSSERADSMVANPPAVKQIKLIQVALICGKLTRMPHATRPNVFVMPIVDINQNADCSGMFFCTARSLVNMYGV